MALYVDHTRNEDELPVLCSEHEVHDANADTAIAGKRSAEYLAHNGKMGSAHTIKKEQLALHAPSLEVVDCTSSGDGSCRFYTG
ncbi:MAG: hypothetical protein IPK57_15665 [Chitinophagaceae bacterium]|nr:hypothetical protein [Chitinophagaceae bacterium]